VLRGQVFRQAFTRIVVTPICIKVRQVVAGGTPAVD